MTLSRLIAEHVSAVQYQDLPEDVVRITKKCVLDALGVMLAANTLGDGCGPFIKLATSSGGKPESTILGFGKKVPAHMAAFANGSLAHALDFEDSHDSALVHSNAVVVPAALAMAESLGGVSGKEFITAIAIGSDLVCRLGLSIEENLLDYGWYMPPILSAFGAAAAVGKLLHLTPDQLLDAFSLVLCQATCSAEITQSSDSTVRSVRDAFAAQAGVLSAVLAKDGVTGFAQPFEGKLGFFTAYARGKYNADALTNDLGRNFEGANVSFKPWPSCRGTHPFIEGILKIVVEHNLAPDDVIGIHLIVSPVNKMLCEPSEAKKHPETPINAKFSLPFVVAAALVHRKVTLAQFTPEALRDTTVLDIAGKVKYEVNQGLGLKETLTGVVTIFTKEQSFSAKVEVPYGHPDNPMSDDLLMQKFKDCLRYSHTSIAEKDANRLVNEIFALENLDDVGKLTQSL